MDSKELKIILAILDIIAKNTDKMQKLKIQEYWDNKIENE